MSVLLETQNISKIYRQEEVSTTALHNVSFSVKTGEFVSIMGASGSGKSTLLHILGLLDRPTKGNFFLEGVNTATLSDSQRAHIRNQKIGFIFQQFHLLARTSVVENVMLPLQYSKVPPSRHRKLAETALKQVEMSHRLEHNPSQLSGGEKQRAVIARALVTKPHVLLADEPTGNLDSKTGATVMGLIDQLHEQGLTVIVITHETPTAQYAQRILTLRDGSITSDVKMASAHHFKK